MPSADVTRRTVLKISLGLSGVLATAGLIKFLGYQPSPSAPTRFTLQLPSAYLPGSVTSIVEARAWLVRDAAGLYAVSAICTHLGCTVKHVDQEFQCPCHGSKFNDSGFVLHGPATQPLPHLELTLAPEGQVVLDTKQAVPASQRLTETSSRIGSGG